MFKQIKGKPFMAAVLSIMLLLSACTTGPADNNGVDSTPSPIVTQAPEEEGTRIINTVMGQVEVPANPQRIISTYVDGDILALGGTLIAADEPWEGCAYYDQIVNLPRIDKWEPEDVMALNPDLIFVIMEEDYHKLKAVAPTVLIPFGEMSTMERVEFIGEALGVPEKAEQLVENLKEKIKNAKEKLETANINVYDKTFTILEMWEPGSIMIMGDRWGRGGDFIYRELGIPAPERVQKEIIDSDGADYILISEEVMPNYCGDIILVTISEDGKTGFEDSAIWESLPAVKNERVIAVSWNMFYFDDILSINAQMDVVVDTLLSWSEN